MANLGWQKRPVCCHFIYFPHYFLCSSKCSCVGNDSPTNFHFLFLCHVATQWKYKKNRGVLRGDTFNREMWRGERDHSSHRETDCVRKLVVWDELKHWEVHHSTNAGYIFQHLICSRNTYRFFGANFLSDYCKRHLSRPRKSVKYVPSSIH